MPCTLKFLELMPQGRCDGVLPQKLAVKLPGQNSDDPGDGDSGFDDIMAALMQMPADQLTRSLEILERTPLKGGGGQWVPLIDLSNPQKQAPNILKLLLEAAAGDADGAAGRQLAGRAPGGSEGSLAKGGGRTGAQVADSGNGLASAAGDLFGAMASENESGPGMAPADRKSRSNASGAGQQADCPAERAAAQAAREMNQAGRTDFGESLRIFDHQPGRKGFAHQGLKAAAQKGLAAGEGAADTPDGKKGAEAIQGARPAGGSPTGGASKTSPSMHSMPVDHRADASVMQDGFAKHMADQHATAPEDKNAGDKAHTAKPNGGETLSQSSVFSREVHGAGDSQWGRYGAGDMDASRNVSEAPSPSKDMQTDIVRQIVQRMSLNSVGRQSQMQISLKPEYMGNLSMEIMTENQNVTIRMTTETHHVKEIIEHNIQLLRSELQQHGLQVQKVDVSVAADGDALRGGQQQMAFRQAQDQQQRRNRRQTGRSLNGGQIGAVEDTASAKPSYGLIGEVDFFA